MLLLTFHRPVLEIIKTFTIISYIDRCYGITRNLTRGLAFDMGIKGFLYWRGVWNSKTR